MVNAFDLIQKLLKPAPDLEALLNTLKPLNPSLQPQIDDAIAKLSAALSDESITSLAKVVPTELLDIAHGKLDPKDHPSDAI